MITLPPGRAVVAGLYLLGMLLATLGSGQLLPGYRLPPGLVDLGHVPLFAGLCLVLLWAVQGAMAPRIGSVAIFCLIFAGVDEWAQQFTPDRVPEMKDFAANVAGVGIGLVVGIGWIRGLSRAPVQPRGDSTQ